MKNELKIKAKVVEVHTESGDNTSTATKISPPKYCKFTLKLAKVEVVELSEMSEILSDCLMMQLKAKMKIII